MSSFDKIIGYDTIKNELMQICDMIKNKEAYEKLGAKFPSGMLLYGDPGLGKSLMAKCLIEECGLEAFVVRKNKSENFVEYISEVFAWAKKKAPAIIFLDDMDKFANEDDGRRDAEEYVAVQAGIDDVAGCGVFVIATVNDMYKLPDSLTRPGRFDRCIEINVPNKEDCMKIIRHYLGSKSVDENLNYDDVVKMISYSSCANLETIINEAAIAAAQKRKDKIEIDDIVSAVLKMEYDAPDELTNVSFDEYEEVAYHEAGHLVMSEILCKGSVGLASLRKRNGNSVGGFIRRCKSFNDDEAIILISLAAKAAYELKYGKCAEGCRKDIERASNILKKRILDEGYSGFGVVDISNWSTHEFYNRYEPVVQSELERYLYEAKRIIVQNMDKVHKVVAAFLKKDTLLASDIAELL